MLNPDLIQKYNVPGPRYTSYPTALNLKPLSRKKRLPLAEMLQSNKEGLSLYMHIPFCNSLCWYCGCSRIITQNPRKADKYLDMLEKEMKLASLEMEQTVPLRQIHFGGGTPTFLSPDQVLRLGTMLHKYFKMAPDVEFGVEIDPRHFNQDMAQAWKQIGMNRASLGVQDTDIEVQKAINRIQPISMTQQTVQWLRDVGVYSLNFDLIYGLPGQNTDTFNRSIDDTLALSPDRFAIYSYAHLPHLFAGQRLIDESLMPQPQEKLNMLVLAHQKMERAGYVFIGMDHFAKPDDALSVALSQGTLHRNFMGYSTHGGLDMLGLGLTSISKIGDHYLQNAKAMRSYEDLLGDGQLPYEKSFSLTHDDQVRQQIIMDIMCKRRVDLAAIAHEYGLSYTDYFEQDLPHLQPLMDDGLVTMDGGLIQVQEAGSYLLRNIAMVFDAYLNAKREKPAFSQTI
jgi:oxygen-independent coproporphyrinogen-3 oxidase